MLEWLVARTLKRVGTNPLASGDQPPPESFAPDDFDGSTLANQDRLRELMSQALSSPTVEAVVEFNHFASRMRRMGPYNVYMVFAQRPGARAVASRKEWAAVGQTVRDDAIPVLILRPKGPITQVYELADTLPRLERDPRVDPLAAKGEIDAATLARLINALAMPAKRNLRVHVSHADFGDDQAGRIVQQALFSTERGLHGETGLRAISADAHPWEWRIQINRRATVPEQFATLIHELGHLFCGHVGAFHYGNSSDEESGWPNRCALPLSVKEIEAELVAWHICDRRGLHTGSPLYLKPYLEAAGADLHFLDLDRVIRAIARVERYLPR